MTRFGPKQAIFSGGFPSWSDSKCAAQQSLPSGLYPQTVARVGCFRVLNLLRGLYTTCARGWILRGQDMVYINLAHSPGSKPSVKWFKVDGLATAGEARRIHPPPSVLLWRQLGKAEAL